MATAKNVNGKADPMRDLTEARALVAKAQLHRTEAERDYSEAVAMSTSQSLEVLAERRLAGEPLDLSDRGKSRDEAIRESRARMQIGIREVAIAEGRLRDALTLGSAHVCREQSEADRADTHEGIGHALKLIVVLCRMAARRDAIEAQSLSPSGLCGELPGWASRMFDLEQINFGPLGLWLSNCKRAGFEVAIPKTIDARPVREAQQQREAELQRNTAERAEQDRDARHKARESKGRRFLAAIGA